MPPKPPPGQRYAPRGDWRPGGYSARESLPPGAKPPRESGVPPKPGQAIPNLGPAPEIPVLPGPAGYPFEGVVELVNALRAALIAAGLAKEKPS